MMRSQIGHGQLILLRISSSCTSVLSRISDAYQQIQGHVLTVRFDTCRQAHSDLASDNELVGQREKHHLTRL